MRSLLRSRDDVRLMTDFFKALCSFLWNWFQIDLPSLPFFPQTLIPSYLPYLNMKSESEVAQSCSALCDPVDCSPPGSSIHGILQARVLEWVAMSFSRGSSQPRDWTQVSRIAGRRFTIWAINSQIQYLTASNYTTGNTDYPTAIPYLPLNCFLIDEKPRLQNPWNVKSKSTKRAHTVCLSFQSSLGQARQATHSQPLDLSVHT